MSNENDLQRFLDAQAGQYRLALSEIKNSRKQSHWMWYIFPQILGLGASDTSKFFAIKDLNEARAYRDHPVLGKRLLEICQALLEQEDHPASRIFGYPDDLKLRSSLTLFGSIPHADPIFKILLEKFFNGIPDPETLKKLDKKTK